MSDTITLGHSLPLSTSTYLLWTLQPGLVVSLVNVPILSPGRQVPKRAQPSRKCVDEGLQCREKVGSSLVISRLSFLFVCVFSRDLIQFP